MRTSENFLRFTCILLAPSCPVSHGCVVRQNIGSYSMTQRVRGDLFHDTSYDRRLNPYISCMVQDMQIRNLAASTIDSYTWHVDKFCSHFGKTPEERGLEEFGLEKMRYYAVCNGFRSCEIPGDASSGWVWFLRWKLQRGNRGCLHRQ